jgi:hypothetical protein
MGSEEYLCVYDYHDHTSRSSYIEGHLAIAREMMLSSTWTPHGSSYTCGDMIKVLFEVQFPLAISLKMQRYTRTASVVSPHPSVHIRLPKPSRSRILSILHSGVVGTCGLLLCDAICIVVGSERTG